MNTEWVIEHPELGSCQRRIGCRPSCSFDWQSPVWRAGAKSGAPHKQRWVSRWLVDRLRERVFVPPRLHGQARTATSFVCSGCSAGTGTLRCRIL
mmetsp:Transcript_35716/g.98964  ORF Transcript_35716/g.98964 Transcript_35716/m.98964 type:complete len:95 (-) Transcript_35716:716-1000(-)